MMQLSKQANDMLKSAVSAKNAFTTFGDEVSALAQAHYDKVAPTGNPVNVKAFLKASCDLLTEASTNLEIADQNVIRESGEDAAALSERDDALEATREGTLRLRSSLEGTYGDVVLSGLGIPSALPRDPVLLQRTLDSAYNRLTNATNPYTLPKPLDPNFPAWTEQNLANRLKSLEKPLASSIDKASREQKETQDARRKRRDALDALYRVIVSFNSIFSNLARLAGKPDIAERIRPRSGKPQSSETPQAPETTEAPATSPSA
ncbi:MAG: hypothetical protein EP343_31015 [Deltaproteobacteria bacterium]|nr:MAG: hypothetical protein EP343_31015 [Deltaproteobacteria bacterium]